MKLEKLKEFNERVKKIYEKICLDNHQTINQELYSRFTSEIDNLSDINPSSLNIAEQILEREGYIGDKILNSEYNNEDINYFEKLLKYILDEFKRLEYLNILGEHNTVVIGGNGSGKSALVSFFKESNLNKIIVIPAQKILYCNNTNSRVTIETIQQNQKENLNIKEKITNENNSITSTTDITNLRVVDLTLEKEGKKYSTNANRTVRIALLNNEKGNEILVYHVKDNGELEELTKEKNNLTITNDNIEFTINHFSKFAIASIKKNIPTPSTNTSEEHNKNKDTRRDLTDIKSSESNQNKILPRTGVSSSSTVLLGATLLSLALISRKLKKN